MDQENVTPVAPETTEVPAAPVVPHLAETLTGDREPYDFDRATIHIGFVIHADDGSTDGRLATVTARSHTDAPVVVTRRIPHFNGPPGTLIHEVLHNLEEDFPARESASRERERRAGEKAKAVAKPTTPTKTAKPAKKKTAAKLAAKPLAKPVAKTAPATAAPKKKTPAKPAVAPKPPKKAPVEKVEKKTAPVKPLSTNPAEPAMPPLFASLGL